VNENDAMSRKPATEGPHGNERRPLTYLSIGSTAWSRSFTSMTWSRGNAELGQEAAVVGCTHSSASRSSSYLKVPISSHSRYWQVGSTGPIGE
jgi:hypothetical protein